MSASLLNELVLRTGRNCYNQVLVVTMLMENAMVTTYMSTTSDVCEFSIVSVVIRT